MAYIVPLLHEIKDRIPDVAELLDDVTTIDQFCERIEFTALKHFPVEDDRNEYKGLVFELFTEFLINSHHAGAQIGITDYVPLGNFETDDPGITITGDYGIDGIGKSTISGKWAIAQVKYRQDHWKLKYSVDHLGNLVCQGLTSGLLDGITRDEIKQRIFFITTAGALHHTMTEQAMANQCHYLDRTHLSMLCDNHKLFWDGFKDSINASRVALAREQPKQLRAHQNGAVETCLDAINNGVVAGQVILPTGTGKTLVISRILDRILYEDEK